MWKKRKEKCENNDKQDNISYYYGGKCHFELYFSYTKGSLKVMRRTDKRIWLMKMVNYDHMDVTHLVIFFHKTSESIDHLISDKSVEKYIFSYYVLHFKTMFYICFMLLLYIYIYIYMCVCVCVYVYVYI